MRNIELPISLCPFFSVDSICERKHGKYNAFCHTIRLLFEGSIHASRN